MNELSAGAGKHSLQRHSRLLNFCGRGGLEVTSGGGLLKASGKAFHFQIHRQDSVQVHMYTLERERTASQNEASVTSYKMH